MTTADLAPAPRRPGTAMRWLTGSRLLACGMLLLQLAWFFAVPPFGGSDEFDHVYKAAAVARGEWAPPPTSATRGTGAWLNVPADLVVAASPECRKLPYTHEEDCVGTRSGDTVRIASGAGRYNPAFYGVIGIPALPFSGYSALYVMRLMTLFVGWLLFCGAIVATRTWATSPWPFYLLAVASTPVLIYSASVVAPNGVEMMASMMFWASMLGLVRRRPRDHGEASSRDGLLLWLAAVSGSVLVTTRSLGPVWCLLAVITIVAGFWPARSRWKELATNRTSWITAGVLLLATLLSTWWILRMGSLTLATSGRPATPLSIADRLQKVLHDVPVSTLQAIAAFPFRNQATQPVVYACYLVLFIGVVGVGVMWSSKRARLAILGTSLVAAFAPVLIQVAAYNSFGPVWQGRYSLPYSLGIALVIGFALDQHPNTRRSPERISFQLSSVGLALFAIAQVTGPLDVLRQEARTSPLAGTSAWLEPSSFVVGALALMGTTFLWLGATRAAQNRPGDRMGRAVAHSSTSD